MAYVAETDTTYPTCYYCIHYIRGNTWCKKHVTHMGYAEACEDGEICYE